MSSLPVWTTLVKRSKRVKTARPNATSVDVIAHGAGGLIARSYIQSSAYQASFGAANLPGIDDLVLVGVPNEGMVDPWNMSADDFSGSIDTRALAQWIDRSYDLMVAGTPISGPSGLINNPAMPKDQFAREYMASLRHLLPTYNSIDTNQDGLFEKISTSNPSGNTIVNDLLTDLNGGNKNAWLDLIGKTHVVYAADVETRDRLVRRVGPDSDSFRDDELLSFSRLLGQSPAPGAPWYEPIYSGHGGDGTVPTFSSIDPFLGDARLGTKLKTIPVNEGSAGVKVPHQQLVNDPFAQFQILTAVGASGFTTSSLTTNLDKSPAESSLKLLNLGIVRPVDAFAEAAIRFKDLLTEVRAEGALATTLAYTSTSLGSLLRIDDLWNNRVFGNLNTLLSTNPGASMASIVAAIPTATLVKDDSTEKSFRFSFNASHLPNGVPTAMGTLNLGAGNTLSENSTYALTGNLVFEGVLGIDLTQGADFAKGLFVRDLNLRMGATGASNNLNSAITLGSVTAAIEGGQFSLDANVQLALNRATGQSTQFSMSEILQGTPDVGSIVRMTPTASMNLNLPLNITNSSTKFSLANFGRPVVKAASQNLFAGTPDLLIDIELGANIQDQLLTTLSSLDRAAATLSEHSAINQRIPGIGRSLNEMLNETSSTSRKWGDLLRFEETAQRYFESFNPASTHFESSNVGKKPTALGLRNAIAGGIDQAMGSLFSKSDGASPIVLKGGVNLATNQLIFDLAIDGSFVRNLQLELESSDTVWNTIGVEFDADAKVDVTTTVDLGLRWGVGLAQASGVDPFFNLNHFRFESAIRGNETPGNQPRLGFSIANGTIAGEIIARKLQIRGGAEIGLRNTIESLSDRLTITPRGALNLQFDFEASLYGTSLTRSGPNPLPSVTWVDDDLFSGTLNAPTLNVEPLLLNLSASALLEGLKSVATWLSQASNHSSLADKIPMLDKSLGEILSTPTEPRTFGDHQIISVSAPIVDGAWKRFKAHLNLNGASASSIGIKPGASMQFLASNGERFSAEVDSIDGEVVALRYDSKRNDTPNRTQPSMTFQIGGTLGDNLLAAIGNYGKLGAVIPSLAEVLNDLAEPLGISFSNVAFNNTTKLLTMTPVFTPRAIQYVSRLDFGAGVAGLEFNASGNFLVNVAPTIRLPLEINLASDSNLTPGNRVALIDNPANDGTPEIELAITAQIDNPRARATLGFFSAVLTEDPSPSIPVNDGIRINSTFRLNVRDPGQGSQANQRATISELTTASNLTSSFAPTFSGFLDIDGLLIKPTVAGASVIPGDVKIFTTTDGTNRGNASFANLAELKTLINKIKFDNSIGTTESLTPESVASMVLQLGNAVQEIVGRLDIPEGIPFVQEAISGVVNFSKITQDFARQLYFNPKLIGTNDIAVTDGRLSRDATFAIKIEGGDPILVTIPAAATSNNQTIDDLYADINAALVAQGLGAKLVAERQLPFVATQISSIVNVTTVPVKPYVEPVPATGVARYEVTFPSTIDLFTLGLRVGDVIQYRDTLGMYQKAEVDQMSIRSLSFRYRTAGQTAPETGSNRSIAIYDPSLINKLAIRTVSPTAGISLELNTVQITAPGDLPVQLSNDLTVTIGINGVSKQVLVTAASTSTNGRPTEMVDSINRALSNTSLDGGKLNAKLRAILVGSQLRLVAVDSETKELTISGAEVLGFNASQSKDTNTARTELGLGDSTVEPNNSIGFRDGMLASPSFRAQTVQDLVHVLNGMIQRELRGLPFTTSLNYISDPRSVTFDIALGANFEKSIDLDFNSGLDVGFAQLNVAGGAQATFAANAGVELTVGIDLDPIGTGYDRRGHASEQPGSRTGSASQSWIDRLFCEFEWQKRSGDCSDVGSPHPQVWRCCIATCSHVYCPSRASIRQH